MPTFQVSQAEKWHRIYEIDADTLAEAKEIYAKYAENTEGLDEVVFEVGSPEFVEDIEGDVVWWQDHGIDPVVGDYCPVCDSWGNVHDPEKHWPVDHAEGE